LTGKVLQLKDILTEDQFALRITDKYLEWDILRSPKKSDWEEVRRYVYATDTRHTSNSQTPWKNTTTIPKLCQIRDNLYANYIATLFPQRKWLSWEANEKESASRDKRDAIENYMSWVITQPSFKHEMDKVILDYIDFGNCFVTVDWLDERVQQPDKMQAGYVGPVVRRISPLDIVMNPTAENFGSSPKIIRSLISLGELKERLERVSNDENRKEYEELYKYLLEIRTRVSEFEGDLSHQDNLYQIDGFTSFRQYLGSDMVEVLTFYGDIFDPDTQKFYKNHVITVVDRHKLIGNKPNPSFFGTPPVFHSPWRKKQDNLWGMGPLDNLVGMQYRLDHIENMRADIVDWTQFPVQKVKGFVEDYVWQPGEKIFVSEEGDVEIISPDVNVLQANFDLQRYELKMEEMAGAPREAMGFRTPGEKTAFEVQQMQNASARLFQNKIKQFEEHVVEPLLNAMLELARRNLNSATTIKVFNDDYKIASFQTLGVEDITGIGRIKPVAARHFTEQSDLIQNLTNIANSPLWAFVQPHWSSVQTAKVLETVFNLQDYSMIIPNVFITEQAEQQKLIQSLQEQVQMSGMTATGMGEDYDMDPSMMSPEMSMSPEQAMQGIPQ
jgi:hypothetical protein